MVTQMTEYVLGAIVVELLKDTLGFARRKYTWHYSTQRIIDTRRHWQKPGNRHIYIHRFIEKIANLIDIEYKEWKRATLENNTRLYRQGVTQRWRKFTQANLEDCMVNPSYSQYLELKRDEDLTKYLTGEKPATEGLGWGRAQHRTPQDEYMHEFNEHLEFIDNKERYKSILDWGFLSHTSPYVAAKVYEDKRIHFPEDFHFHNGCYDLGHIYRFIDEKIPKEAAA